MKRSFLHQNSNVFFTLQTNPIDPKLLKTPLRFFLSLSLSLEHKDRKREESWPRVCVNGRLKRALIHGSRE